MCRMSRAATILSVSSPTSVFSKAGEDTDADIRLLSAALRFSPWLCDSVVNLSLGGITRLAKLEADG